MILYHTTSFDAAEAIKESSVIQPKNYDSFVSFAEDPFTGDISANDVTLTVEVDPASVEKVEYTKKWYKKHPEQASYIAGEGWIEQFEYPDTEDEDEEEEAYRQAELESFLWKSNEKEWISKTPGEPVAVSVIEEVHVKRAKALAQARSRFQQKASEIIIKRRLNHVIQAINQHIRVTGLAFKHDPGTDIREQYKGIIEYPGFHTTTDFNVASMYAIGRVAQSFTKSDDNDVYYVTDYPVVVSIDMSGHTPKVDYDAAKIVTDTAKIQLDSFLDELEEEDTDEEILDKLDHFAENLEYDREAQYNPLDMISEGVFSHFEIPINTLRNQTNAVDIIKNYQETGSLPDEFLMDATNQYRYTEDVSENRIQAVWYITPTANKLLTYDMDEAEVTQQYPGFDIPSEDDVYGGYWNPAKNKVYEAADQVNDQTRRIEYHGTTYKRLLQIAPELNLPEPPSPPYAG